VTSLHNPDAPPMSASEEIRSGWSPEREQPKEHRKLPNLRPGEVEPLDNKRLVMITALGAVAVLGVWFVLFALFFSNLQESHSQHVLYTQFRPSLAQGIVPFGGDQIEPGTPVALINSKSLGLHSVVIVEGTSSKELESGPGHFPGSPFPGQLGDSRIFGRSATFGSPFANVHALKPGNKFTIITGQGAFNYVVVDVRGPGQARPSLRQLGTTSYVTLATSTGSGWRGGWAPTHAIFADAALVGKAVPAPPNQPTRAPRVDHVLASDTGNLVPLVLWLQALVLLSIGLGFAYDKWGIWQLWIVGLPAFVAVLWGATTSALLLLPNLA
jgi:sortase A